MINRTEIKENVKILLNIQDPIQDRVLDIMIKNIENHLFRLLRKVNPLMTEIPSELSYVIEEITVIRFNKLGSEGMKSESVEGHSVNYYDLKEEFAPYMDIINDYASDSDNDNGKGKVIFI